MKLIGLIGWVFLGFLNLICYIIVSPVLAPLELYRWSKNTQWRKVVKVNDRCFFVNALNKRSYGEIKAISDDGLRVRIERQDMGSKSSGWHDIKYLKIV